MAEDPFYSRKPVPDAFIQDIGETGLSRDAEFLNRERKFSTANGGDIRKFSNPGKGKNKDPFYQRKQVPDAFLDGVGDTGLTKQEEFANRERKFSLKDGSDARKFSFGTKGGLSPISDPYYGRKPVAAPEIHGVGETGYTKAEEFEIRERKQSLFQLSDDPFAQLSGKGHRASVVNPAVAELAATAYRRKSSAMAPDAAHAAARNHSGFNGTKLGSIDDKAELPNGSNSEATATESINPHPGHVPTHFDPNHQDPDDVAPHEVR